MSDSGFLIPQQPVMTEREIKKSRFLGYLEHAPNTDAARAFVEQIRQRHRDARHHCWAYVAGAPDDSQCLGCSDDGEPAGTAGRPMLAALQGAGLGEVCVVIARYFGGTKLGTGGLVRAYGGCVTALLETVPTVIKKPLCRAGIVCRYDQLPTVQYLLDSVGAENIHSDFQEKVALRFDVVLDSKGYLTAQLRERTQGEVELTFVN